jgi:hypothetical protein
MNMTNLWSWFLVRKNNLLQRSWGGVLVSASMYITVPYLPHGRRYPFVLICLAVSFFFTRIHRNRKSIPQQITHSERRRINRSLYPAVLDPSAPHARTLWDDSQEASNLDASFSARQMQYAPRSHAENEVIRDRAVIPAQRLLPVEESRFSSGPIQHQTNHPVIDFPDPIRPKDSCRQPDHPGLRGYLCPGGFVHRWTILGKACQSCFAQSFLGSSECDTLAPWSKRRTRRHQ